MSAATERLARIAERRAGGERCGIASVCSAHPVVLEAALSHGAANGLDVLIEATCNQVNHEGGYTGMTPADFRRLVEEIAGRTAFPLDRLILGGDHLGPNPWTSLAADAAMEKAKAMVAAYVAAGFTKLHLDTSMACAGDPVPLPDAVIAERAADLAAVAEVTVARIGGEKPVYIIGTEVPVPGGAFEALDHVSVTLAENALSTVEIHREAFARRGLDAAFSRAIGVVVQPGVEFGNAELVAYQPDAAVDLVAALDRMPQCVFEAHSTDYQSVEALRSLVDDGFALLKVGPWLTFALRETLYGLSHIADILAPDPSREALPAAMERAMLESPGNWQKYYPGTPAEQRVERHFSMSDRIRYYWNTPIAQKAVAELMGVLADRTIPLPLVSQYLAHLAPAVASDVVVARPADLARASVSRVLDIYHAATAVPSASIEA